MGNFNYARAKATATRMLTKYGPVAGAVLLKPGTASGGEFNPTESAAVEYACKCVMLNYNQREIDGQRILATDKKVYVSTENLTEKPTTAWQLRVAGITYQIANAALLEPGDTFILGELQCRRA